MTEPNDAERQRFEAWITTNPIARLLTIDVRDVVSRDANGVYRSEKVGVMWLSWQAAIAGGVRFGEPLPMPVRNHGVEYLDETT